MQAKKVFIDGSAGTTGLRIRERLALRKDIELLTIDPDSRKDPAARAALLNEADIVFLCLPDAAAIEAVSLITNPNTCVLDTSTAHRTDPDWVYGMPELSGAQRQAIASAKRIAVPGCHASGFIALIAPLVASGLLRRDAFLACTSITGYSGGGKSMIADYQDEVRDVSRNAPREYGLTQQHKHLKEMRALTGLDNPPAFMPIVADFYSGMLVSIPLPPAALRAGTDIATIHATYAANYKEDTLIAVMDELPADGMLAASALSMRDDMQITVSGGERIVVHALYDNLGKGASGAAVQCMNLLLGTNERQGLTIR